MGVVATESLGSHQPQPITPPSQLHNLEESIQQIPRGSSSSNSSTAIRNNHNHKQQQEQQRTTVHALVHKERAQAQLPPLHRSAELDAYCKTHAKRMARQQVAVHSVQTADELHSIFKEAAYMGENVQSGSSLRTMHALTMKDDGASADNILGDYNEFGAHVQKGDDGRLYLCQVFRKL
jgi:uncharacterized protein YkwD